MAGKGFLSLLFVTADDVLRTLITNDLPIQTLRERNVGSFWFCETAAEARDDVSFNFPDLVFIDDVLPDGKGADLATEILKADPSLFVVCLQFQPTMNHVMELMDLGVKGVIAKPLVANAFDRYIQYYFKETFSRSWNEVEAITDRGVI